jgi:hypothetical protein
VRYEAVTAMLLNEFLKEQRKMQEQGATIAELKKEIANLTATVKEPGRANPKGERSDRGEQTRRANGPEQSVTLSNPTKQSSCLLPRIWEAAEPPGPACWLQCEGARKARCDVVLRLYDARNKGRRFA